ncbi:thermonuclease family protein [Phaeovulum vinaykumarii]|uniref:thermonuclease family protein n=1 Tax=Phaeovulum vinaykumarii TaxID=407234 RepID=UPI00097091CA|nr:thermonuclease family protein [Phaeovulum vinaykumarii]
MKHIFASAFLATAVTAQLAWSETIAGTASVIDGDTLEIHGTRIRLSAIDAIESRQLCTRSDGRKWNCGKDAAFALANKIGRAPISCDVSGTDRYRRSVAVCSLRGEDLNGWLVENGWAVAYRRYGTDYVPAEDRARAAGRGIWASNFVMPWDWRRGAR